MTETDHDQKEPGFGESLAKILSGQKVDRRIFLKAAAAGAAGLAASTLPVPNLAEAQTGPQTEEEKKLEQAAINVFKQLNILPSPDNFVHTRPKFPKLTEYGGYKEYIPVNEYIDLPTQLPEELRDLGIKVTRNRLVDLLLERYRQILTTPKGPVAELASTIDPTVDYIKDTVNKISQITGIPQDVILALGWRENALRGQSSLHGDPIPVSGDGMMAPNVQLYQSEVYTKGQGIQIESGFKHKFIDKKGPVLVFSFPADGKIVITPIPVELIRSDSELNLYAGLIFYHEALESLYKDKVLSQLQSPIPKELLRDLWRVILKDEVSTQEFFEPPDPDIWDIAYTVYHHGVLPAKREIEVDVSRMRKQMIFYDPPIMNRYFYLDVLKFSRTRRLTKPWEKTEYRIKDKKTGKEYYSPIPFAKLPNFESGFIANNGEFIQQINSMINFSNVSDFLTSLVSLAFIASHQPAREYLKQLWPEANELHQLFGELSTLVENQKPIRLISFLARGEEDRVNRLPLGMALNPLVWRLQEADRRLLNEKEQRAATLEQLIAAVGWDIFSIPALARSILNAGIPSNHEVYSSSLRRILANRNNKKEFSKRLEDHLNGPAREIRTNFLPLLEKEVRERTFQLTHSIRLGIQE